MKLIIFLGVGLSMLGLMGLIACIREGLKIKRFEREGNYNNEKIKNLLGRLYIKNMVSLTCSFLGLIMITIGIILDS